MKQIKVIIERSKDSYWSYAENLEGVSGVGDTPKEAMKSAMESLELQKELGNIPKGKYKLVFKFDTQSLINYYSTIFTNSALERMTGINQKQIQHYSKGIKKPRPAQVQKIETALHKLGKELLSLEL